MFRHSDLDQYKLRLTDVDRKVIAELLDALRPLLFDMVDAEVGKAEFDARHGETTWTEKAQRELDEYGTLTDDAKLFFKVLVVKLQLAWRDAEVDFVALNFMANDPAINKMSDALKKAWDELNEEDEDSND